MIVTFPHNGQTLHADLSKPIDLSIPLSTEPDAVNAFHIPAVRIEPLRIGNFVGDVSQGGSCNVNDVHFNPHGNGTHTETVGHISRDKETIYECMKHYWYLAKLVSVQPSRLFDDWVIMSDQFDDVLSEPTEAIIVRTRPNDDAKRQRKYSGTNPVYMHPDAAQKMAEAGVRHLLIDLPSVDKEEDGGALLAHHAYWQYPSMTRKEATITELIFVPDEVRDGLYLLNLQVISILNDASPSKPILYHLFHAPGKP
ncbi:MAG: cyclase family protein [Bacteroidota bacterium]